MASLEVIRGICGRVKTVSLLVLVLLAMLPLECDLGIDVGTVEALLLLREIVGRAMDDEDVVLLLLLLLERKEGSRTNFEGFVDFSPGLASSEGLQVGLLAFAWGIRDEAVDP